jgi:hypothetical protein
MAILIGLGERFPQADWRKKSCTFLGNDLTGVFFPLIVSRILRRRKCRLSYRLDSSSSFVCSINWTECLSVATSKENLAPAVAYNSGRVTVPPKESALR